MFTVPCLQPSEGGGGWTFTYICCVEYLLDVEHVCDMPGVLGKDAEWQCVFPHKACGGVGQTLLLIAGGDALL